jgi:ABC-2 type transport system ATP-binding protein
MLGLIQPTYGDIHIAGVDMRTHPRDACRKLGFMPDFPPLHEDLKCWEFLDLFAASYFVPKAQRREVVEKHLDLVGLTEKRNAMTAELSRGMRQRLTLAKTLIPDPTVLMLDEPASGMDPHGRIALKNILKEQGRQGKTVLVSSHILAEMSEFCTFMAIMEKGKLVVSGPIDEVRERVMGGTVLEIEVLGDDGAMEGAGSTLEQVRRIVGEDALAGSVESRGRTLTTHYTGTAEQAGELLRRLILADVRVGSFSRRKEGLEELFLKIGASEVS